MNGKHYLTRLSHILKEALKLTVTALHLLELKMLKVSQDSSKASPSAAPCPSGRPSAAEYIVGLDLLRFACAAGVAMFHLAFASWSPDRPFPANVDGSEPPVFFASLSSFGWIGVQIFFVISGFVIADTTKTGGPGRFIWSRILRLYPAAIACATITLVSLILSLPERSLEFVTVWLRTLTLSPVPASIWIDPVYWTLAVEIVFYFAVFLALWVIGSRAVFPTIAFLGIFSAFAQIMPLALEALYLRDLAQALRDTTVFGFFGVSALALQSQHGAHFTVGAAIWILQARGVSISRLGVLVIGICGGVAQILADDQRREAFGYYPVDQSIGIVAIYLLAVTLIALSVALNKEVLLSLGPRQVSILRFLGLLTYPLYLLHNYVGVAIIRVMLGAGSAPIFAIGAALAFTVVVSIIVLIYFERPLQSYLRPRGAGFQNWVEARSPLALSPKWRSLIRKCGS